ncbi:MAG: valine--pyruvate transaminase, partial [Anaerolineae bacterium]
MKLSKFGKKFTGDSGLLELMADFGHTLGEGRQTYMLGGGNPAHIPAVQARFRECMQAILDAPGQFERMIGNYAPPQGDQAFIDALAGLLQDQFGRQIGPQNIALTNGSQTAFFILFNLFAGEFEDGSRKKILLPLAPEYIGYADVGLSDDFFV